MPLTTTDQNGPSNGNNNANANGNGTGSGNFLGLTISTALANHSATSTSSFAHVTAASNSNSNNNSNSTSVVSPRNDFFVSQRTTDYELSRVDSLSLEEQEIMANIQELQLQLMQLRAEQEEDSDDDATNATNPQATSFSSGNTNQLIIVSNTLPVLLERVPQSGRWKATKTTGGLDKLMCLTGVRNDLNFLWVGWVGQHIPKHEHESVRRLLLQHNCLPVFLSSDVATRHSAFSSEVLWSLFHYVSEPIAFNQNASATYHATKRFNKQDWRAYESANESFADAIAEIYNEGDAVWIHDYHLMLLPSLLRQRLPLCQIGWFLHTPFPVSDVYCRLPVRAELLRGVLQSDLVGFQTFDYERHFVSTCERLLGVECSHKGIRSLTSAGASSSSSSSSSTGFGGSSASGGSRDRFTSIGVFPIGISVEPFARAASSVPTLHRVNDLHRKFGTKRIILGVDRLDNIKGIPHKLLAMELLLQRFPEWQHNVVLIQIGISSRSGVVDSTSIPTTTTSGNTSASGGSGGGGSVALSTSPTTVDASSDQTDATTSTSISGSPPSTSSVAGGVASSTSQRAGSISSGNVTAAAAAASESSHHVEMSSQSYRNLLAHVNQLVGRINGTFGTLDYAPIHFIHQRVMQHEELCALYDLADVCLVTSTRDGMNLVSHEFVVCQQHFMRRKEERKKAARAAARAAAYNKSNSNPAAPVVSSPPPTPLDLPRAVSQLQTSLSLSSTSSPPRNLTIPTSLSSATSVSPPISPTKILTEWEGEEGGPGVLIVSEFAGCSQSLSGAIVTNPWNTEDVALSVHQALSMCRAEREIRQQKLYRYVSSNTATAWSMQFLNDLGDAVQQNKQSSTQLPKLDVKQIVTSYKNAHNRVIILDYDRTLTPQHALLPLAAVGPNFKSLLDTLSADEKNTVFIVSARERKFLETWLQGVRVGVAAEDGFFYRMNLSNDRELWKSMSKFQYGGASLVSTSSTSTTEISATGVGTSSTTSRRSMSLGAVPSFAATAAAASGTAYGNYYAPSGTRRLFTNDDDASFATSTTGTATTTPTTTPRSMKGTSTTSGGGPHSVSSMEDDAFAEESRDSTWKNLVLPTMMNFTDRTPGSYIEDKESSLTWHYGDADPHFGGWQAKDLQIVLERQLIGTALEVYQGHNWVAVEHEGCTKANVLEGILKHLSLPKQVARKGHQEVDFVLCVCDDWTDDQMFQTLNTLLTESKERHEKMKLDNPTKQKKPHKTTPVAVTRSRSQQQLDGGGAGAGAAVGSSASSSSGSSSGSSAQPGSLHRSKSAGLPKTTSAAALSPSSSSTSSSSTRRKSDKPSRRRKTRQGTRRPRGDTLGQLAEAQNEHDDDAVVTVDEDNKVAFSRLQKVPVRMAQNVAIFTLVVGQDVQHSAGRHTSAFAVDSLSDVRKVLKEFADTNRPSPPPPPSAPAPAPAAGSSSSTTTAMTTATTTATTGPTDEDEEQERMAESGYEASHEASHE